MKRTILLILSLAMLSVASGMLLSKASWIGRVGMTFFYKEYNLLKIWWQGAIAVYIVLLLLFALHAFIQRTLQPTAARVMHIAGLLIAGMCLYLTYDDFTNNLSHRLLGWRFHYGFYLGWVGWILICLFYAVKKRSKTTIVTSSDKTVITTQ